MQESPEAKKSTAGKKEFRKRKPKCDKSKRWMLYIFMYGLCMCAHVCVHVFTRVCLHVCTHVCLCACVSVCVCMIKINGVS